MTSRIFSKIIRTPFVPNAIYVMLAFTDCFELLKKQYLVKLTSNLTSFKKSDFRFENVECVFVCTFCTYLSDDCFLYRVDYLDQR